MSIVNEDSSLPPAAGIPSWLNESFFENIFKESDEKKSNVKLLKVEKFGGKGESFSSLMYRAKIKDFNVGESNIEKSRSLIVKTPINSDEVSQLDQEIDMYGRVLPELKRVLEAIGEDGNIYPEVIAIDKELHVIVMEDLRDRKYILADRFTGFNLNHSKMALRKLASMHAASVVLNQRDPGSLSKFNAGIFNRKDDSNHVMFESMCDLLIAEVSTWEGYEQYAIKLKKVRTNLIENGLRVFDCDEGDLHVLTHGDLWTNNILFRYDNDGEPKDCVLIDFPGASIASPAIDLLYFLFGSTNDEVRENSVEELLQYYYQELKNLLEKLDHDMTTFPTLQAFQKQISKKYFYALTTSLFEFAIMLTKDEDASAANLMSLDERAMNFKRRMFKDLRYQKNAKMMFPRLEANGLFDL